MGAVYRVHSALTQRVVAALKVMKPTAEPDARARFVREAEALSALRHPAIVRVMGFSEDPERGLLYLVMELAVGETLRARMARGPMALAEALATFVPLAQGLDHAHARGHLPPRPQALQRDPDPGRHAAPGGLRHRGRAGGRFPHHHGPAGHAGLPAARGLPRRAGRAAAIDVYAFGLLLHEALTGERPFLVEPGLSPAAAAAAVGVRKLQATPVELPAQAPERAARSRAPGHGSRPRRRGRACARCARGSNRSVERRGRRRASRRGSSRRCRPRSAGDEDEHTTRVPEPDPAVGRPRAPSGRGHDHGLPRLRPAAPRPPAHAAVRRRGCSPGHRDRASHHAHHPAARDTSARSRPRLRRRVAVAADGPREPGKPSPSARPSARPTPPPRRRRRPGPRRRAIRSRCRPGPSGPRRPRRRGPRRARPRCRWPEPEPTPEPDDDRTRRSRTPTPDADAEAAAAHQRPLGAAQRRRVHELPAVRGLATWATA